MENNIESMELEEMRQQMAELKVQLDEQLQLNEDRLHKSILKQKYSIHSFGFWSLIGGTLTGILAPLVLYIMYDFSLACCIITSVFCIADAGYDYWSAHRIKSCDLSTSSITEMTKKLISMKKMNTMEFITAFILLIPMLFWWGYEFLGTHFFDLIQNSEIRWIPLSIGVICGIVGGIVGAFIAIHLYKKQKHNIEDLLNMIDNNK